MALILYKKYGEAFDAIKNTFLFLRSHRNTVIASPNGGSSVFNNSRTSASSSNMSSSQGINNHNDINSIHQFSSSQAHPVTATTTPASQISQQINGCEVVSNKTRQILINHSNDAVNVGVVSESYLHSQQQVKVSHHETSSNEIRFESMKNLSEANQSTMTNTISPAGRKVSAGDENAMVTIVTINNSNSSGV